MSRSLSDVSRKPFYNLYRFVADMLRIVYATYFFFADCFQFWENAPKEELAAIMFRDQNLCHPRPVRGISQNLSMNRTKLGSCKVQHGTSTSAKLHEILLGRLSDHVTPSFGRGVTAARYN